MKITSTLFLTLVIVVLTKAQSPVTIEQMKQANELQFQLNEARNLLAESQLSTPTPQKLLNFDDADNDGMTDTWETAHGFDPTDPKDAFGDADNDEVLNLFEFQLSADPHSSLTPSVMNVPITDTLSNTLFYAPQNTLLRLQSGTYPLNFIFFGTKRVMIQGGWNSDYTQREPLLTPTILDGQNIKEVFYVSHNTLNGMIDTLSIVLDGLHFRRGKGNIGAFVVISQEGGDVRFSMKDCSVAKCFTNSNFNGAININHWDSTKVADVSIVNTLVASNNPATGIKSQVTEGSQANWRIINSTITNNRTSYPFDQGQGYSGFTLEESTQKKIKIVNSILSGNQREDIKFHRHIEINASYSNVDSISSAPYTPANGSIYNAGPGTINQDAMFVDSAALNYYLLPGSPCLDSGIEAGLPYLGAAPDMGAFEGFGTTAVLAIGTAAGAVKVYPNPARSIVTFDCSNLVSMAQESPTLLIFNQYGQEVINTPLKQDLHAIDCKIFLPGIYFYQVLSKKSIISSGKLGIVR